MADEQLPMIADEIPRAEPRSKAWLKPPFKKGDPLAKELGRKGGKNSHTRKDLDETFIKSLKPNQIKELTAMIYEKAMKGSEFHLGLLAKHILSIPTTTTETKSEVKLTSEDILNKAKELYGF